MSRRHAAEKRKVLPEPKYGDLVLAKFINNLMVDGKKSVAERIVYNAFDRVEDKLKKSDLLAHVEQLGLTAVAEPESDVSDVEIEVVPEPVKPKRKSRKSKKVVVEE